MGGNGYEGPVDGQNSGMGKWGPTESNRNEVEFSLSVYWGFLDFWGVLLLYYLRILKVYIYIYISNNFRYLGRKCSVFGASQKPHYSWFLVGKMKKKNRYGGGVLFEVRFQITGFGYSM
jgi:hypothetical protein